MPLCPLYFPLLPKSTGISGHVVAEYILREFKKMHVIRNCIKLTYILEYSHYNTFMQKSPQYLQSVHSVCVLGRSTDSLECAQIFRIFSDPSVLYEVSIHECCLSRTEVTAAQSTVHRATWNERKRPCSSTRTLVFAQHVRQRGQGEARPHLADVLRDRPVAPYPSILCCRPDSLQCNQWRHEENLTANTCQQ